ncbi:MAG: ring-cleaving dioxygenase [Opitutales bacterium]|nr:ring-cleaving dioxygenase [Opitutales bacterium]
MNKSITGIHHITAIAGDPQANLDFYTGVLGLRLIKRTVNFDDPSAYHLYYGDETGTPGSIVTFFYWPGHSARGRIGSGQSTAFTFSTPVESIGYWEERLGRLGVDFRRVTRFGEETLQLDDPDHLPIEIVGVSGDERTGWGGGDVPAEHALKGFHTAELTLHAAEGTERLLLDEMHFRPVRREGNRSRFEAGPGGSGRYVDLVVDPSIPSGLDGAGTIHHVAWSVPDDATEVRLREKFLAAGHQVSPVIDRDYFHSIYYREPGRVLFEVATEQPGFTIDESLDQLGASLRLPKRYEPVRGQIEKILPPLRIPEIKTS